MALDLRPQDINTNDLVGYRVEATDGYAGRVHRSTVETPLSSVVVETGRFFHRPHEIPARFIQDVDHDSRLVMIRMTKRQLRRSSEYVRQDSIDFAVADEQESVDAIAA